MIFLIFGIYYDHPLVKKKRQQKQLAHILSHYYSWPEKEESDSGLIHIALIIRDGDTYPKSSAFIRLIAPLTSEPLKGKVSFKIFPENTTRVDQHANLCIVQRNAFDSLAKAEEFVGNLRSLGVPLIIDSDDAFHSIDVSHPEHDTHRERLEAFNYLIREAGQVWLSTPHLASSIGRTKSPPVIVSNSLDERLWKTGKKTGRRSNKGKLLQMLYMGTVSHDADFEIIFPVLDKLAKKYPGSFRLTVMGVSDSIPSRTWLKRIYQKRNGAIYPRFVNWLLKQGPFDIGLSPLINSAFNEGKSDIKCLDYLAAGAIPVVSDLEPYESAELDDYIIRVKNTSLAWEKTLDCLINNTESFRADYDKKIQEAQLYISNKRSSRNTSQQIWKLVLNLAKRKS